MINDPAAIRVKLREKLLTRLVPYRDPAVLAGTAAEAAAVLRVGII